MRGHVCGVLIGSGGSVWFVVASYDMRCRGYEVWRILKGSIEHARSEGVRSYDERSVIIVCSVFGCSYTLISSSRVGVEERF